MWNDDLPPSGHLDQNDVQINDVLYEYDGPLIFHGVLKGILSCIVSKVLETDTGDLFMACQVDNQTLKSLKDGRLSVYGAFAQNQYWIYKSGQNGEMPFWLVDHPDIPERFFARPGKPLHYWQGSAADSLDQAEALLSLKFQGFGLSARGMPLGKLKALVDQSYSSMKKLLTPPSLINSRASTFDFEVAPIKFASLHVSAISPVINMGAIRRSRPDVTEEKVKDEFYSRQSFLTSKLAELESIRNGEGINKDYATKNFVFLSSLVDLLPKEDGFLSSTEISSHSIEGHTSIVFDKDGAQEIRDSIEESISDTVTEVGSIGGFIEKSGTVRFRSRRGKEVTCVFSAGDFEALTNAEGFKKGARIEISGRIIIRPKVDLMKVSSWRLL